MTQAQYNEAINLIGHVILTSPAPLIQLLYSYGITFTTPTRGQLIDATVDLLHSGDARFTAALSTLVEQHIDHQGNALLALRKAGFNSYMDEDDFFGGLVKGAIGALGGLFKKKKKKRSSGSSNSSSSNNAHLQALQAKRDLERRIERMQQEQRRREEQQRREREERQRRARRTQMLLIAGGGVLVLGIVAVVLLKPKPASMTAAPYYPPKT